ncbi:MAG TPA: dihydropteroate synthase [Thermoplasmatales archaeon]|nr:dihydropteroate synthase [Thermoplasmatales archaeon]
MKELKIGDKRFQLGKKTIIMGILNVTPDSFSDGGRFLSVDKAVKHALQMEKDGVDIIDIGGESTRPGSSPVTVEEEMQRVLPVLEQLIEKTRVPLSIDTYKSKVAEKALDLGANMINDVSALRGDPMMVKIAKDYDVPICLMHMKGTPKNMQVNPSYDDVMQEIIDFFKQRIEYVVSQGIKKENIIVDPGIGFGKRTGKGVEDNCEILRRLPELKKLGFPILIGASRKTFIGNVCGGVEPLPVSDRLEGSLAAACVAVMNGADIIRVHDVKETRRCIDLVDRVIR